MGLIAQADWPIHPPYDRPPAQRIALIDRLDRPIAFQRSLVEIAGSVNAALLLSQAIYWQKRIPPERDGWWYKTRKEWFEETGLSRYEQEEARKKLTKAAIFEEQRRGMPAKIWFRVDLNKVPEFNPPIAFHRSFVTITGSVNAALLLSQALYWQNRIPEERDGWWYKTRKEWVEETGLSRYEQEEARRNLRKLGILDEHRRGLPATNWFRIDPDVVEKLLREKSLLVDAPNGRCVGSESTRPIVMPSNDRDPIGQADGESKPETTHTYPSSAQSAILDSAIQWNSPALGESHRPANFLHAQIQVKPPKIHSRRNSRQPRMDSKPRKIASWWNSSQQQAKAIGFIPRWWVSHQQSGGNPADYIRTENTTETTPPPQTPPPHETRGGVLGKPIGVHENPALAEMKPTDLRDQAIAQDPESLVFPMELSQPEREAARRLLRPVIGACQQILDVLAAMILAGQIRKSPLAVLRGLVERWKAGTFDPADGIHIAVARQRRAESLTRIEAAKSRSRLEAMMPVANRDGPEPRDPPKKRRIPPQALEVFTRLRRQTGNSGSVEANA